jgi:hypothetical protein
MSEISGKAMKKATLDLRCMALRKPDRESVVATSRGAESAASTIVCLSIHQGPAVPEGRIASRARRQCRSL